MHKNPGKWGIYKNTTKRFLHIYLLSSQPHYGFIWFLTWTQPKHKNHNNSNKNSLRWFYLSNTAFYLQKCLWKYLKVQWTCVLCSALLVFYPLLKAGLKFSPWAPIKKKQLTHSESFHFVFQFTHKKDVKKRKKPKQNRTGMLSLWLL